MPQPLLRTERLVLVPLAERHLELEVRLDADAEVMRYLTGRAQTPDQVRASHVRRLAVADVRDGLGYWVAYLDGGDAPPTDAFVGLLMLPPAEEPADPHAAELGYRIARRHWRQGFATEASRALLRHGFETVGLTRILAQTMTVNHGSQAVLKALGMRHVRTFFPEWDEPLPGAELGEVEYEITRDRWRDAQPGTP